MALLPTVRICCGPRCGAEPGHRRLYDAVERAARQHGLETAPTMCRSTCGNGVTVVRPDTTIRKVRTPDEAEQALTENEVDNLEDKE